LFFGGIVENTKTEMKFSFFRCCRILIEGISEVRKTCCVTLIDLAFSPFLQNDLFAESQGSPLFSVQQVKVHFKPVKQSWVNRSLVY